MFVTCIKGIFYDILQEGVHVILGSSEIQLNCPGTPATFVKARRCPNIKGGETELEFSTSSSKIAFIAGWF